MRIMNGNLWDHDGWKCITTNGIIKKDGKLTMGAGIALTARERYHGIDLLLGKYVKQWGNRPFIVRQHQLITFPTKNDWRKPSDIDLIKFSANEIVKIADKYGLTDIALPPPGCGNGGLQWNDVRKVIEPIFDDRFIVIRVNL